MQSLHHYLSLQSAAMQCPLSAQLWTERCQHHSTIAQCNTSLNESLNAPNPFPCATMHRYHTKAKVELFCSRLCACVQCNATSNCSGRSSRQIFRHDSRQIYCRFPGESVRLTFSSHSTNASRSPCTDSSADPQLKSATIRSCSQLIVSFLSNSKESFRKVRNCSDGQAKSTTPAELSVPERAQAPRGRQTELEISVNSIQIYIQSSLFITR